MKKYTIFASLILFISIAKAEIIDTNNILEIREKFAELQQKYQPSDILVVFSIKDVILKPINPEFKRNSTDDETLLKKIFKQAKLKNLRYLDEVIITNYKHELSDSRIAEVIKHIEEEGAHVIGLTNYITGKFNKINRFEVWIDQYLNKFNITFANSYPESNDITFTELKTYNNRYPVFYNGILNCNTASEYKAFAYFVTHLSITPKAILIVGNNVFSLDDLQNQIKSYSNDIETIGFYYNKSDQKDSAAISDKGLIKFWSGLIEKINNVNNE
jgi:hypothetical protein